MNADERRFGEERKKIQNKSSRREKLRSAKKCILSINLGNHENRPKDTKHPTAENEKCEFSIFSLQSWPFVIHACAGMTHSGVFEVAASY